MHTLPYRKIVRLSGLYDFIVTLPFVTPWTFQVLNRVLNEVSPTPAFEPIHVVFVNLFGSIVIVWSILRIRSPKAIYGAYDAAGRLLFFTWFMTYLLNSDFHPVILIFGLLEITWFVLQVYGFWKLPKSERYL
ncbi:hypothetical protein [Pseudolactococcus carnosus]|uniref:Integral membrane protein n=1 Tax=Pseudolactococcus carnosus TaxID=2749961 RepID=A0ABT0ATH4_9LACT|nr:hypothetical protein [Lactococcus carnosus]MCJ1989982.1 hypothetical protein [Lactococcus carnosus]